MRNILHIEPCVPPEYRGGEVKVNGTKVTLPDGTPVTGITKIEIIGEVDQCWRAVIYANVTVGRFDAVAEWAQSRPLSWWRRLLLRVAGVRCIEGSGLRNDRDE